MAKYAHGKNPNSLKNLKMFTSEYQPEGHKKKKKPVRLKKFIQDVGFSATDMVIICRFILTKSMEELQILAYDKKLPVIVSGTCRAFLKDMSKGQINVINWLTERGFGKALEKMQIDTNQNIVSLTPDERRNLINSLIQKRGDDEAEDSTAT